MSRLLDVPEIDLSVQDAVRDPVFVLVHSCAPVPRHLQNGLTALALARSMPTDRASIVTLLEADPRCYALGAALAAVE